MWKKITQILYKRLDQEQKWPPPILFLFVLLFPVHLTVPANFSPPPRMAQNVRGPSHSAGGARAREHSLNGVKNICPVATAFRTPERRREEDAHSIFLPAPKVSKKLVSATLMSMKNASIWCAY